MKNFIPPAKVHVNNRLTPPFWLLPIKSERTLYRVLERIGKFFPVLLERYQQFLIENGLADNRQIIDFPRHI